MSRFFYVLYYILHTFTITFGKFGLLVRQIIFIILYLFIYTHEKY